MDRAKPGHMVEFTGLKGAAHLNGPCGTLVRYRKKEQRWSVRCELDDSIVKAKPTNLILQELDHGTRSDRPARPGPTEGSVLAAGGGVDSKEEYYLRTLMALALQAEAADESGGESGIAQDLVVDAIGAFVDGGEMDGEKGKRFVAHLHRWTQEEHRQGNGHEVEIMGFIDTGLLSELMDRIVTRGPKDRPATVPKFLHGSMTGSLSFRKSMMDPSVNDSQYANAVATEVARRIDAEIGMPD